MKKPELLSPAGNFDSLKAAILAGCDAVYLGGKVFGARSFADNFINDEIVEAINYSHLYGVKVYVTVNTLIYEDEVNTFLEYVDFLYKSNVDALIIQDIGMMDLIRKTYPLLELHASTQMHIHNLEGTKLMEELGIKRVVLARETDVDVIDNIKKNTNVELEIFVHGALCISYSGQCLMSSLIGGRSGNRGSCAGCCRQTYSLVNDDEEIIDKYLLSTKDLNSLENVGKLIDVGVDSFKIEGRMKSASYVYMVTKLYRNAIDSYLETGKVNINEEDLKSLKKIFNREFTKGFLFKESNNKLTNDFRSNHQGLEIGKVIDNKKGVITIKLTEDLNVQDGIRFLGDPDTGCTVVYMFKDKQKISHATKGDTVSIIFKEVVAINSKVVKTTDYLLNKEIELLLKEEKRRVNITGIIETVIDKPIKLSLTDGINTANVLGTNVERAISSPISSERIIEQISKLGNTVYNLTNLELVGDTNIFISIKELNDLKTEATNLLNEKRLYTNIYRKEEYKVDLKDYPQEKKYNILINDVNFYNKIKRCEVDKIYTVDKINDGRQILKLERVMNEYPELNEPLLVGELGGVYKYDDVTTDFSLNVTNSYSVAFLNSLGVKKITLSYELELYQIREMIEAYRERYNIHPNLEVIVFGKEEAMISKFNLNKNYGMENTSLKDRFDNVYPISIKNNLMHIYNYKAKNIENYEDYFNLGINSLRFNIIDENDLELFLKIFKND